MSGEGVISSGKRATLFTPDGQAIVTREYNALTPHPHPKQNKRLVPTAGVNRILVDHPDHTDGLIQFECDTCGKVADTAMSIRGHMSSHNENRGQPKYALTDLAVIVAAVEWVRQRIYCRNYSEIAARILNETNVKRVGVEGVWTADAVSKIYTTYANDTAVRGKVIRAWRTIDASFASTYVNDTSSVNTVTNAPPRLDDTRHVDARVHGIIALCETIEKSLNGLAGDMLTVIQELSKLPVIDADITDLRAKAEKLETLQRLLGGS